MNIQIGVTEVEGPHDWKGLVIEDYRLPDGRVCWYRIRLSKDSSIVVPASSFQRKWKVIK